VGAGPIMTAEKGKAMSISDTISQVAATDPTVGVAVASAQTKSAIVAGLGTGDAALGGLLGAASTQALETSQLLSGLTPNLGQNVDLRA